MKPQSEILNDSHDNDSDDNVDCFFVFCFVDWKKCV